MKALKSLLSLALAALLLFALPLPAGAREAPDLRAGDFSDYGKYPVLSFGGGFHTLYIDDEDGTPRPVFDKSALSAMLESGGQEIGDALRALDLSGFVDAVGDAILELLGEALMNDDGDSVMPGVHSDIASDWRSPEPVSIYDDAYIRQDYIQWGCDWRLDPIENAKKFREYMLWIKSRRPEVEMFNLTAHSGTGAIMLAYLDLFPEDLGTEVASAVFYVSMHRGTTMFGQIAKGDYFPDAQALGKTLGIGFVYMDLTQYHPYLRAAYETGLMDLLLKALALVMRRYNGRIYDEIITPVIYRMPGIWACVPRKDFAPGKAFLLKGDPKYAKLEEKLDSFHEIASREEEIILEAAKRIKVGVRAGYGFCMTPIGSGTAVQADYAVDTHYASLGATCAPLGVPFKRGYRQALRRDSGNNYVSPDRLVDASTCLLPDQTWFDKYRMHNDPDTNGGWHDWFLAAPNPTVFDNPVYPQYVERVDDDTYVPVQPYTLREEMGISLEAGVTLATKIWRRALLLPLFWVPLLWR